MTLLDNGLTQMSGLKTHSQLQNALPEKVTMDKSGSNKAAINTEKYSWAS
jgi:hypothetical protein